MKSAWSDAETRGLSELELLAYRSRLIGADPSLVLAGGGNTSSKGEETDFRGRRVRVLRIKASGVDLKHAQPLDFPGVRLDPLLALTSREAMADDEMLAYIAHCALEPGGRRPSIETLLHAFVPAPHVDHTHPDAILSILDAQRAEGVQSCFAGSDALLIGYQRPGFALSQTVWQSVRANPGARFILLHEHGLVTWGSTHRECCESTLAAVSRAEAFIADRRGGRKLFAMPVRTAPDTAARRALYASIAPVVRGAIGESLRQVLAFDDTLEILDAVCDRTMEIMHAWARPATPDQVIHVKPSPLIVCNVPGEPDALIACLRHAVADYRREYLAYVARHTTGEYVEPLDASPRVLMVAGLGLITAGRDIRSARVAGETFRHILRIWKQAECVGERFIPIKEGPLFDIEYWPLERYRASLSERRRQMEGRVALVTGAGGGIGCAIARRLARAGAHLVIADVDATGADRIAREIQDREGEGMAVAVEMDVASEPSVRAAFEAAVVAYGGLDLVVSNAGIAKAGAIDTMPLEDWRRSLDVNATGHFLVTRESLRILKAQGTGGAMLFVATKNVPAPGRDFAAYSAAKAAETQLARVAALEAGPHGVRVNVLHPDGIFRDSNLWSEDIRRERARAHGIDVSEIEDFYRKRNLMHEPVYAEDVAEAALFLLGDGAAKTTGAALAVDGGVSAAFPR